MSDIVFTFLKDHDDYNMVNATQRGHRLGPGRQGSRGNPGERWRWPSQACQLWELKDVDKVENYFTMVNDGREKTQEWEKPQVTGYVW